MTREKKLAQELLDLLLKKPGAHNEQKHALWMYIHDNKVRS